MVGVVLGVYLLYKWKKTGSRPMLHFSVYFLGCTSYFLRALIDIGYANSEYLSRTLYFIGMAALYLGVLPGVLLMMPPSCVGKALYSAIPAVVFVVVLLAAIFVPMEETEAGVYVFMQPYHLWLVRVLHGGAGGFAICALAYLSYKIQNMRPAAMALAFILIFIGTVLMGTHAPLNTMVGSLVQGGGLVIFFLALVVMR